MKLARARQGADVVVVDGMQGGTAATQHVFIEHAGIPTLAAVRQAVDALEEHEHEGRRCSSIVSGGIRTGADVAKAHGAGRRRRVDRPGRADRASAATDHVWYDRTASTHERREGLREAGHRARLSATTCHTGELPGGHDHPGPRARERATSSTRTASHRPTTSSFSGVVPRSGDSSRSTNDHRADSR